MYVAAAKVKYTFSDNESEKFDSEDDFPVDAKTNGRNESHSAVQSDDDVYGPSDNEDKRKVPALTIKRNKPVPKQAWV